MSVLSTQTIRLLRLLEPCSERGRDSQGNSFGLSAAGYDLRLDQDVVLRTGEFKLASTMERFHLPTNVVAIVHDKSSLARRGIAVQNTVADPGWSGWLTVEITNHGPCDVSMKRGDAIGQVIFHQLDQPTDQPYSGKYQNQERGPQTAR